MNLQKTLRVITIGLLYLIPLFAIVVANPFFFPYITGKAFFFRIIIEIAFAGWITLVFLDTKYRPKLSPLTIGITFFVLVTLLADLIGMNPLRSLWSNFERMEGWVTVVHLWMLFLTMTNMFAVTEKGKHWYHWHRWFMAELGVATFVGLYGLLQLAGVLAIHQGSTRIDASLGNAAYMAVYMLLNVGIAAYVLHLSKQKWNIKIWKSELWIFWISFIVSMVAAAALISSKQDSANFFHLLGVFTSTHPWLFIGGTLLMAAALLYPYYILPFLFSFLVFETATRGTILGLIGGIVLACLLYALFAKGEPRKFRFISLGVIALIVLVGAIFWANRTTDFVKNNEILNRMATISWNDSKTQARGYIWPMALEGFKERPILGWGQENFNYIFNQNYNPNMWNQEQWFDRAHNVYLDWLTASGVLGLIAYLALYVLFLMAVWKSPLSISQKSILTGLIAAYAVHNVFVFDNIASYIVFFVLLAFVNSFKEGRPFKLFGTSPARHEVVEYVVLPSAIVILGLVFYFVNVRPMMANTRLIGALQACSTISASPDSFIRALDIHSSVANQEIREQLYACTNGVINNDQFPGPTKQAFFTLANKEIQAQIEDAPEDARTYMLAGSLMNALGQYEKAGEFITKALELSPEKQSIALQQITVLANTNKLPEAEEVARKTYEAAPNYDAAKQLYLRLLLVNGKEAYAREIFGNDPTLFENEAVASIYTSLKQYDQAIDLYKKLVAADPSNADVRFRMAQTEYASGRKTQAVATLQALVKDRPEFKEQIDAAIKEIQQ